MVASAALLIAFAAQAVGCSSTPPSRPQESLNTIAKPVSVKVVVATEGSLSPLLTYTGDVKPKAQVNVSAKGLGRIEKLTVDVGSDVRAGDKLGSLDRLSLDAQMRQADASVALAKARLAQMEAGSRNESVLQAEANLDSAGQRYASLREGGRAENVAQAKAGLQAAEARLAQLKAGPTKEEVEAAEAGVRGARNQLYAAQAQADAYIGSRAVAAGAMVFTKEMKEAQAGAAYEQIIIAEARLAALKAGPTPQLIEQAQAAVDQARAALELAQNPFSDHDLKQAENAVSIAEQQLKLARNPFTENDMDVARAQVAQAAAAVELVRSQLAEADIVAPIDGVVAEKYLGVGALASPQIPVLTIVSPDLEIALSVEESRVGQFKVGQPVSVSVSAYPGKEFRGSITSLSPTVDPRTRTLAVKLRVDDEEKSLKAGMFARVSVNLEQQTKAMLIPEQALVKRGAESSLFVVSDGKSQLRRVGLGASDGKNAEITSGLAAGTSVVLDPPSSLKDGDPVSTDGG